MYLQATARRGGPAFACLELLEAGGITLFVSAYVLDEVVRVLGRADLRRKFALLTDERVGTLLTRLQTHAVLVPDVPIVFTYERDPDDAHYVNLAVAVGARYLVSRDRDLLDLMDANRAEARDFRQRFPGLAVLDPVSFLQTLPARPAQSSS